MSVLAFKIGGAQAPSAATVGMAMGTRGTGISAEAAGMALLVDDGTRVQEAMATGRRMSTVARRGMNFGLGASFPLAASLGFIEPATGAVFQEVVGVLAILNALRVRRAPREYKRPSEKAGRLSLPDYQIVINYVSEGEVANLVRGFVELKGARINFTGVAYGRFGGQNFSPQLSPSARRKIKELVGDVAKFEEDLQLRLVRGEFDSRPPKGEKHTHAHLGS